IQPLISVVVPIYKVEPYLRQCIDSIIAQTYKNLEIILVDDGSPDDCGKICDEYARGDHRIIVVHKENGGLSDARNAGIEIANGEFITYIDSDDWVAYDMIEFLYRNLISHDADISTCGIFDVYKNEIIPKCKNLEVQVFESEQAVFECFKGEKCVVSACAKLYRKNIFDYTRYPTGKYYEDLLVIIDVFYLAKVIVINTDSKYYYRQRIGSTIHTEYGQTKVELIDAWEQVLRTVEDKYPALSSIVKTKLLIAKLAVLRSMISNKNYRDTANFKKMLSTYRKNYWQYLKCESFNLKGKIMLTSIKVNVKIYEMLNRAEARKKEILKRKIMFE
ncbi:MAG: glycosyltransferase, partial [Clostridiales bacterium]|nr:glycosyltransferase [Clostridiales bacterium]